jgi:hypothetical protein
VNDARCKAEVQPLLYFERGFFNDKQFRFCIATDKVVVTMTALFLGCLIEAVSMI